MVILLILIAVSVFTFCEVVTKKAEKKKHMEEKEEITGDPFEELAAAARDATQSIEELIAAIESQNARTQRSNAYREDRPSHRCDGDCANCPPHYGYRYGRWYYGHGHTRGCQRGGPGGDSRCTYRD